jgi:hypothetical protein
LVIEKKKDIKFIQKWIDYQLPPAPPPPKLPPPKPPKLPPPLSPLLPLSEPPPNGNPIIGGIP